MEDTRNLPWHAQLHWRILIAMILGIGVGYFGGSAVVPYIGWLGTLFVRLLPHCLKYSNCMRVVCD